MAKRILMIAGPNGAGKTTNAQSFQPDLVDIYEFINADEIARGLAPLHPESMALVGGHHVPEKIIRRRYQRGLKNIVNHYLPLADSALLLNNSNEVQTVIAKKSIKNGLDIENNMLWEEMRRLSNG